MLEIPDGPLLVLDLWKIATANSDGKLLCVTSEGGKEYSGRLLEGEIEGEGALGDATVKTVDVQGISR